MEWRQFIKAVKDVAAKADLPPQEEQRVVQQLIKFFGRSPVTRRNFVKITAAGVAAPVIMALLAKPSKAAQLLGLTMASPEKTAALTQSTPSFSTSVLRKEDMLALRFDFYNLKLQGDKLVRQGTGDAFIVVNLAHGSDHTPQNIGEEAYLETDPNMPPPPGSSETPKQPGFVGALLAGPSRLAFKVPTDVNSIPFTMDELLSWEKYELSVSSLAKPEYIPIPPPIVGQVSDTLPPLVPTPEYPQNPPGPTETAIEVPWHLIMSPNKFAGWAHALQPVTHNGLTELWHTRLGVRKYDSQTGQYGVDELQELNRTLRAIWTRDPEFNRVNPPESADLGPFRMSLTRNYRWQLVRLTSDYEINGFTPMPVRVERFMLSALGAWMRIRGEWKDPPDSAGLDIIEWRHIATMGRDHYVRVVKQGFLFPTGHAAVLVCVTERKFQAVPWLTPPLSSPLAGHAAAYLRQRYFIIVRQPVKTYKGIPYQPYEGRQWPFRSVRITTLITPNLNNPNDSDILGKGQDAFWPRVGNQDFQFHLIAEDLDGRKIEFTAPLAFISSTLQEWTSPYPFIALAISLYNFNDSNKSRRERPLDGQKVAFAPSSKPGDTSAEVKTFVLGAALPDPPHVTLENQPRFFPVWQEAAVRLPAAEQVKGGDLTGQVVIQPHPDFLANGWNNNPGEIFAKLKDKVPLGFSGSADRSGAIITPNMDIGGISRSIGLVGGKVNQMPTKFDPSQFFSDAKILGGILLSEIIGEDPSFGAGDGRKTPKLTSNLIYPNNNNNLPPEAVETRLDWRPDLKEDPLGIFDPKNTPWGSMGEASMEVKGTFITPLAGGPPTYNILGDLCNFTVNMIGKGEAQFLILHLNKLTFTAQTGKKPNVDVDIDKVKFAGVLSFVETLRDFLKTLGTGLNIDITPTQVSAGYTLPIPTVGVGVLSIQNIALGVKVIVPFTGNPARVRFNFSERERPFLITVFAIGGGGFFALEIGLDGVERLEAALEFGASMALDIGVASGEVHIMGGIYFEMQQVPVEKGSLTSYIRMGGSVEVLGIVSISIEFYLAMVYQLPPANELWGQAILTVEIEILCFSVPVELSVERRIAGPSGGSAEAAALAFDGAAYMATPSNGGNFEDLISEGDWKEYAEAFAPTLAA